MNVQEEIDLIGLKGKKLIGMTPNELSAPIHVVLEITHKCNLNCMHCGVDAGFVEKNRIDIDQEMSFQTITKLIDRLDEIGVTVIILSGGEPLLREDVFDIINYINSKKMDCALLTNGVLIDQKLVGRLKNANLFALEMNLNSVDARFNDKFFGKEGSYDAIVNSIKMLVAAEVPLRVNIMCAKNVSPYFKETVEFLIGLGVKEICLAMLRFSGRSADNAKELMFTPDEYADLVIELDELYSGVKSAHGDLVNLIYTGHESEFDLLSPIGLIAQCGAGRLHCTISPDGDVRPCPYFPSRQEFIAGNVIEKDFKEIWETAQVFKEIRDTEIKGCTSCNERVCMGGCRLEAHGAFGTMTGGPDPYCKKKIMKKIRSLE